MMGGEAPRVAQAAPQGPTEEETKAASVKKALEEEKDKKGRTSTILTGGQGASGSAPTAKKTLLGQ